MPFRFLTFSCYSPSYWIACLSSWSFFSYSIVWLTILALTCIFSRVYWIDSSSNKFFFWSLSVLTYRYNSLKLFFVIGKGLRSSFDEEPGHYSSIFFKSWLFLCFSSYNSFFKILFSERTLVSPLSSSAKSFYIAFYSFKFLIVISLILIFSCSSSVSLC